MIDAHHGWNVSFKPLVWGFLLSLFLTFGAYALAEGRWFTGWLFIGTLFALGVLQALIQCIFFFHLGVEEKPRWNLMIFLFMVLIIFILVGGSLWIMYNLNYHMMPMAYSPLLNRIFF